MTDEEPSAGGRVFAHRGLVERPMLARHVSRVAALFDALPIGVAVWSVEGELLHANPVMRDLLGPATVTLEHLVFEDLIDARHAVGIRRLVDEAWTGDRNHFECDLRCARPDGAPLWLRAHVAAVYGQGGRPEYFLSQIFSFASRSARQPAERLLDESPDLLWVADELGIPRSGNARCYEFLGVPPGSGEMLGALFEAIHPDDYASHEAYLAERISGRLPYAFTARSRAADGSWRWLHHRARPLIAEDGTFEGFSGASTDVTALEADRRHLESVARLLETVAEAGPVAVVRTDAVGRVLYANGQWAGILDEGPARLEGLGWRSVLAPEHVDEILERAAEAVETGQMFRIRVRAVGESVLADGPDADERLGAPHEREGLWAELRVAPVFDDAGEHDGFVATLTDISAEVAADALAGRLARVLDAGTDFVIIAERTGRISYANAAATSRLAVRTDDDATLLFDLLDGESFTLYHEVVDPVLADAGRWQGELALRDRSGSIVPVSALVHAHTAGNEGPVGGHFDSVSVVARDISALKDAHLQMEQLASHDYLTGLPNRRLLYERIDQALARRERLGQSVALLFLDLDRFKPVNDRFGHHVGDAVLVTLADRIHRTVRQTDTPARIGGDEFAVLVEGFDGVDLLERVATRLVESLSRPVTVEGTTVQLGVSIGIVAADAAVRDADTLLARADAAMYRAKAAGRGRFEFAAPEEPA